MTSLGRQRRCWTKDPQLGNRRRTLSWDGEHVLFRYSTNILAQKLRNCLITRQKYQKICCTFSGPDFVDRVFSASDRNVQTLRSLQALYGNGRLANTGYVSILSQLIKASSTLLGHHLQKILIILIQRTLSSSRLRADAMLWQPITVCLVWWLVNTLTKSHSF